MAFAFTNSTLSSGSNQYQTQHCNQQQYGYSNTNQGWVNPQQAPPYWTPSAPQSDLPPSYTDAVSSNKDHQDMPKVIR